jgi:hypothetical protein
MKAFMSLLASGFLTVQQPSPRPAVPVDPVVAIADAFRSHSVVAVSEAGHGEEWGYTFLLSLLHDSRFVAMVDDIVIENGSARYQDVADRFVRGESVSEETLSQVWRNTVTPGLEDDRWWIEVFRAARAVNASQRHERRIRVLLGDPPIEWENVRTPEEHRKWVEMRDIFPADLIQREVIEKGRRALLRYGQMHYQRKQLLANYESEGDAQTIVSRLEHIHHASVFTIWTSRVIPMLQADAASWPVPSIALVRGTALGVADFTAYYPSESMGRFALRDGKADFSNRIPRTNWRTLHAEDQFDAVLYPGPKPAVIVQPSRDRCADKAGIDELLRRMMVAGPPPMADQLKRFCDVAASN